MEPLKKKGDSESVVQTKLIDRLTLSGWYCIRTHGNAYQRGFPDVFACSKRLGTRWIEVKKPTGSRFTQAQLDVFGKFASKLLGVWVLTAPTEYEYNKLFLPANWHSFLYSSRGITINDKIKRIQKYGPEGVIQDSIIEKLTKVCPCNNPECKEHALNNWFCLETYGSVFQSGLPDIFCCHKLFGTRWIECKNPKGYKFTPAQVDVFPSMAAQGVPIHILMSSEDFELEKIYSPSNWHTYMWKV